MKYFGNTQQKQSCPPCATGKATRAPFKKDSHNIYALLEELTSDTTGPISPGYGDGNNFIQLLVAASTGWTDVQVMKAKRRAGKAIMHSLAKIQILCNAKAKRLHTDGAKEQDTNELRKFLDDNGTKTSHTAPNASQSNALTERRFRQLSDASDN